MCRFDVSLTAVTLALLLSMPSGYANAQEDIGASAAKTKIGIPTKVVDSKGKTVGTYEPINETWGPYGVLDTVLVTIRGTTLQLAVGTNGFTDTCANERRFYFSGSDCTGAIIQVQNGN